MFWLIFSGVRSYHGNQPPLTQPSLYTFSAEPSLIPATFSPATLVSQAHDHLQSTAQALSDSPPFVVVAESVTGEDAHDVFPYESVTGTSLEEAEEMREVKTKATIGVLSTIILYMCTNSYLKATHPEKFIWQDEDREEAGWIASSRFWLDRKSCRWLGVCGGLHMRLVPENSKFGHYPKTSRKQRLAADHNPPSWNGQNAWTEGNNRPEDWDDDERVLREIPEYVMEYAPLVHLYSGEQFWPCDIAEHLYHITPTLNYTPVQSEQQHPTLQNLDDLNEWDHARWVFLTSKDNVEERPEWLEGAKNIPRGPTNPDDKFEDNDGWVHKPGRTYFQAVKDAFADLTEWFAPDLDGFQENDDFQMTASGKSKKRKPARHPHYELKRSIPLGEYPAPPGRLRGGRSDAPAVLVTVNKGHGIVDAFWFFFYSFNLGNVVLNVRFGNHVGDWEHTVVRFQDGEPKAVFFSEHNFGSAYSYEAVEKLGKRPVIYSAYGTHAMYALPGLHPYILPWGILHDTTDRGPLWDPALNAHAYTYDFANQTLRSSNYTPNSPIEWFEYSGHWGDKFYPLGDKRQYRFAGQYHYVNGPFGPKFKHLGRKKICQGPDSSPCVIKNWLGSGDKIGRMPHTDPETGDGADDGGDDL
ncbi:Vacuolar protein sorting-associated protein 62 [Cladophialophora chaetospira]|uniref:Vacuolar protein sorting-associated protein 62 n=1 Tax=Cladophialophora chaetospira TaxID=386627 RepID=A0AA38XI93_9EURO|nr:Vacuolar protein sorting-associated protein 62 [Cladophialophora chaetospira]